MVVMVVFSMLLMGNGGVNMVMLTLLLMYMVAVSRYIEYYKILVVICVLAVVYKYT